MKAFIGKKKYSGTYDEDLDGCIQVFDTLEKCAKCQREKNSGSTKYVKVECFFTLFDKNG